MGLLYFRRSSSPLHIALMRRAVCQQKLSLLSYLSVAVTIVNSTTTATISVVSPG